MNRCFTIMLLLFVNYVALGVTNDTALPKDFKTERKQFMKVIDDLQKAFNIAGEIPDQKKLSDQIIKETEVKNLIEKGITESKLISDEFLDFLCPKMRENFRQKLIYGNELLLNGLNEDDSSKSYMLMNQGYSLLGAWQKFVDENENVINTNINTGIKKPWQKRLDKLLKPNLEKRSVWRFIGRMLLSSILLIFIYSFYTIIFALPMLPLALLDDKLPNFITNTLAIILGFILAILQAYFWILWGGYGAKSVQLFTSAPTVKYQWIYYVLGFIFIIVPLNWLGHKEVELSETRQRVSEVKTSTTVLKSFAGVAFIVFLIFPNVLKLDYFSWLNNLLY